MLGKRHHEQRLVRTGAITPAVSVGIGDDYLCAADPSGTVHCWGDALEGRLGNGTQSFASLQSPVTVVGLP